MKVIFLDFDGVLNSEKYVRTCGHYGVVINPAKMILLKKIVDATNAKIVLSTSWREHWVHMEEDCDEMGTFIHQTFKAYQMEIFDKVPKIRKREDAIKAWLETTSDVTNFLVLDDMFLCAEFLEGHFVRTSNFRDGLSEEDVLQAISILNRKC